MRAMKSTKTEVNDAGAQLLAIELRQLDMRRERGRGNCLHEIHT
jgi:hypothetical protein